MNKRHAAVLFVSWDYIAALKNSHKVFIANALRINL